jgi:hypothetical protein
MVYDTLDTWSRPFHQYIPQAPRSGVHLLARAGLPTSSSTAFELADSGSPLPGDCPLEAWTLQSFQESLEEDVFGLPWQEALSHCDNLVGLDLRLQCVDGAMIKAPLRRRQTGKIQRIVPGKEPCVPC